MFSFAATLNMLVAGSGFIDFDEFVAVMSEYMPADDSEQMRAAFTMMDKDGSGKVDDKHQRPDLQNILRQSYDYLTIMPK